MNNKQSYHAFLKQLKEHKQKVVKEIETQQEEMEMQQAKEEKKARKEMKSPVKNICTKHLPTAVHLKDWWIICRLNYRTCTSLALAIGFDNFLKKMQMIETGIPHEDSEN